MSSFKSNKPKVKSNISSLDLNASFLNANQNTDKKRVRNPS